MASHREYILARIVVEDRGYRTACWIWQLRRDRKGYGRANLDRRRTTGAHRLAYSAFVGPVADDLVVDHLCRVPACCNPEHLEPVTNTENQRRARGFNYKDACIRGHPFPENRYFIIRDGEQISNGCRLCMVERRRKSCRKWRQDHPDRAQAYDRKRRGGKGETAATREISGGEGCKRRAAADEQDTFRTHVGSATSS